MKLYNTFIIALIIVINYNCNSDLHSKPLPPSGKQSPIIKHTENENIIPHHKNTKTQNQITSKPTIETGKEIQEEEHPEEEIQEEKQVTQKIIKKNNVPSDPAVNDLLALSNKKKIAEARNINLDELNQISNKYFLSKKIIRYISPENIDIFIELSRENIPVDKVASLCGYDFNDYIQFSKIIKENTNGLQLKDIIELDKEEIYHRSKCSREYQYMREIGYSNEDINNTESVLLEHLCKIRAENYELKINNLRYLKAHNEIFNMITALYFRGDYLKSFDMNAKETLEFMSDLDQDELDIIIQCSQYQLYIPQKIINTNYPHQTAYWAKHLSKTQRKQAIQLISQNYLPYRFINHKKILDIHHNINTLKRQGLSEEEILQITQSKSPLTDPSNNSKILGLADALTIFTKKEIKTMKLNNENSLATIEALGYLTYIGIKKSILNLLFRYEPRKMFYRDQVIQNSIIYMMIKSLDLGITNKEFINSLEETSMNLLRYIFANTLNHQFYSGKRIKSIKNSIILYQEGIAKKINYKIFSTSVEAIIQIIENQQNRIQIEEILQYIKSDERNEFLVNTIVKNKVINYYNKHKTLDTQKIKENIQKGILRNVKGNPDFWWKC